MKMIILIGSFFTFNAFAAYPVSFTCKGVASNQEKINFSLKGLIGQNPAANKESGTLTLNLAGQTNKGAIKITEQSVSVLKTKSGTLTMYSTTAPIKATGYNQVTIAVTNKNNGSSTLTFFDLRSANLDSIEYAIKCAEEVK